MSDPVLCNFPRQSTISPSSVGARNVLSSVGAVVHEKELDVRGVLDKERLVAGRSHMAGLAVGTVTDLSIQVNMYVPLPPILPTLPNPPIPASGGCIVPRAWPPDP